MLVRLADRTTRRGRSGGQRVVPPPTRRFNSTFGTRAGALLGELMLAAMHDTAPFGQTSNVFFYFLLTDSVVETLSWRAREKRSLLDSSFLVYVCRVLPDFGQTIARTFTLFLFWNQN